MNIKNITTYSFLIIITIIILSTACKKSNNKSMTGGDSERVHNLIHKEFEEITIDKLNEETVSFAVIGMPEGAARAMKEHEEELNVTVRVIPAERFRYDSVPDLSQFDIIFVSFASVDYKDKYREALLKAYSGNEDLKVFAVGPPFIYPMWVDWVNKTIIKSDRKMASYYGLSKRAMKNMLKYTLINYCSRSGNVEEPDLTDLVKLYHPKYGELKDIDTFFNKAKNDGYDIANTPRVVIGAFRHHLLFHQPKVIEALFDELEKSTILPLCIVADDKDYTRLIKEFKPDLVIQTSHTMDSVDFWNELGVPRIHAVWFTGESIDEWRESSRTGLNQGGETHMYVMAELKGSTECLTSGGTETGNNSGEEISPIPDRIRHIAGRTKSWIKLAKTDNSEKKIAIVFYDREADKSSLMSGPAHCLNAPKSLFKLLKGMEESGYNIKNMPANDTVLLKNAADYARQMGTWEPGPLDKLARSGRAALIPQNKYRDWFEEKVPQEQRTQVINHWGQAPGDIMVWEQNDTKYLVIPKIDMGNIVLLSQPPKGETITASKEFNENLLPPTHHYLATYFWMEEEFGADAVVHFGTHGTEWLFPGKQAVLSRADWSDIMLGNMPNINPWLSSNIAEHIPCKRRAYAVTPTFMPPPLMQSGLSQELSNLESNLTKYFSLDNGALKDKFARTITEEVKKSTLNIDWLFNSGNDRKLSLRVEKIKSELGITLTDNEIKRVSIYLHDLKNEEVPASMHVLGEIPDDEELFPYLVLIMGKDFLETSEKIYKIEKDKDKAEFLINKGKEALKLIVKENFTVKDALESTGAVLTDHKVDKLLEDSFNKVLKLYKGYQQSDMEIKGILNALNGRFIPPGSSGSPERNADVVPGGKNMYVLNPEELPSKNSWELGKKLLDDFLKNEMKQKGKYPEKVAFSLVPYSTFSDYGIIESQILYLMGMKPVWDKNDRVTGVEIIPAVSLGRPRIDVFVSVRSVYRDELPTLASLIDKAITTAASLEEENNNVYFNSLKMKKDLVKKGILPEKAEILSKARIYGAEPDEVIDSHNWFFYLSERTGEWDGRDDLLEVYLTYSKHVYTEGAWGENSPQSFDMAIKGTTSILRSWYDNRDFVLSNKFAWWVDGTLSLAVKEISGEEPDYLFVDVREQGNAKIVNSEEAVQKDFQSRLINPNWIKKMQKEGYAGATAISKTVNNMMGWEIMRNKSINDKNWESIKNVYVDDKYNLQLKEWFDRENPYAFQDLTITMLETIRKDYWKANKETKLEITKAYAESVVKHGKTGGIREGGNEKLSEFIEKTLSGTKTEEIKELLKNYRNVSEDIKSVKVANDGNVAGKELIREKDNNDNEDFIIINRLIYIFIILIIIIGVIIFGFRKKRVTIREKRRKD